MCNASKPAPGDESQKGAHYSGLAPPGQGALRETVIMSSRPRVFATRRLPGDALARLAPWVELEVWPGSGAPEPEALAVGAAGADGLLCLLTGSFGKRGAAYIPAPIQPLFSGSPGQAASTAPETASRKLQA